MSEMETGKNVMDSIERKLDSYYGAPKENSIPSAKYGSYEEAKEAGDVVEMIGCKLLEADARASKKDLITLSNQYSSTMSIIDIQRKIPSAESIMKKSKSIMDRMYEAELNKVTKYYQKSVGGLQQEELAKAKAKEAVDEWADADEEYQKAVADYLEAKREYTALSNAKDVYIEGNKELIEAERVRAKREELLSSGILAELGIIPSQG